MLGNFYVLSSNLHYIIKSYIPAVSAAATMLPFYEILISNFLKHHYFFFLRIISTELSGLVNGSVEKAPAFLKVRRCNLTEGSYPQLLLDKWDAYHTEKTSENDRPDEKLFLSTQKFVILELSNGGK